MKWRAGRKNNGKRENAKWSDKRLLQHDAMVVWQRMCGHALCLHIFYWPPVLAALLLYPDTSWHHICNFTTKMWKMPGMPLCCGETELSSLADYLSLKLSYRCYESGMLWVWLEPKLSLSFCFLPYTLWRTRGTEKQTIHIYNKM